MPTPADITYTYTDPTLGAEDVTYTGSGPSTSVRAFIDIGHMANELSGVDMQNSDTVAHVRVSDVASPRKGDTLVRGITTYKVRSAERLNVDEWTLRLTLVSA